jgi:hypothetical protein
VIYGATPEKFKFMKLQTLQGEYIQLLFSKNKSNYVQGYLYISEIKGKAIPLQAWTGP